MSTSEQKVVQYLDEARASELALALTLRAHIAITPRGEYRSRLDRHLGETNDHARRLQARLRELGPSRSPWHSVLGLAQSMAEQALVLAKGPVDLARGFSPEEKMLKNAKDECATEALEIATYDALEALARAVGDGETADLAASIRGDEERMLDLLRQQIPELTEAVLRSEMHGERSYNSATTVGAAETVQRARGGAGEAAEQARQAAGRAGERSQAAPAGTTNGDAAGAETAPVAEQARAAGDVVKAQAAARPADASESDLSIADYDSLNAGVVVARLGNLSVDEIAKVDAYERSHKARISVLRVTESRLGRRPAEA